MFLNQSKNCGNGHTESSFDFSADNIISNRTEAQKTTTAANRRVCFTVSLRLGDGPSTGLLFAYIRGGNVMISPGVEGTGGTLHRLELDRFAGIMRADCLLHTSLSIVVDIWMSSP